MQIDQIAIGIVKPEALGHILARRVEKRGARRLEPRLGGCQTRRIAAAADMMQPPLRPLA
jgi:hypothetical protein